MKTHPPTASLQRWRSVSWAVLLSLAVVRHAEMDWISALLLDAVSCACLGGIHGNYTCLKTEFSYMLKNQKWLRGRDSGNLGAFFFLLAYWQQCGCAEDKQHHNHYKQYGPVSQSLQDLDPHSCREQDPSWVPHCFSSSAMRIEGFRGYNPRGENTRNLKPQRKIFSKIPVVPCSPGMSQFVSTLNLFSLIHTALTPDTDTNLLMVGALITSTNHPWRAQIHSGDESMPVNLSGTVCEHTKSS